MQLKHLFYELIDGKISHEQFMSSAASLRKTKLVKGYLHGIRAITKRKRKRFSVDPQNISKNEIKAILKMIQSNVRNKYLPEFEKGYLYAWRDYLFHIKKLNK